MPKVNLQPIEKPQGVRDRVTRSLRAAIISGEMTPGEVYSAPSLASSFNVSATPVREAMLDLVKEGLVERIMNRGFRVTEVDARYLDEIAELRLLIEPSIVCDVVPDVPAEDIPRLLALAETIVESAANHDLVEYTEADKAFHLALLEYGGNQRIVNLIDDLRGQARLAGLSALADQGVLSATAEDHIAIVRAIEARDQELTHQLMVNHIRRTRGTWAGK